MQTEFDVRRHHRPAGSRDRLTRNDLDVGLLDADRQFIGNSGRKPVERFLARAIFQIEYGNPTGVRIRHGQFIQRAQLPEKLGGVLVAFRCLLGNGALYDSIQGVRLFAEVDSRRRRSQRGMHPLTRRGTGKAG